MPDVLLLLGSNIDKERNIPAAVDALQASPLVEVCAVSSVLETPAVGADGQASGQESFHNVAVHVRTALGPQELRTLLRTVEGSLGRVRSADKFAPRPIDIDISLYDQLVMNQDGVVLPDPDIQRFAHVAVPLAEIAPDWIYPTTGERLDMIAARLVNT